MQDAEDLSSQGKDHLAGEVMDSLGVPREEANETKESNADRAEEKDDLPRYAKERLGRQEKRHQREIRDLRTQIESMNSRLSTPQTQDQSPPMNPYTNQAIQPGSMDEQIHKAVSFALNARDEHERKAKDAERVAHVHKQYQGLQDHLDRASSKYDDFDDVVRAPDAPYTDTMRDTSLLLPNAADVLYKLGKNKDELKRIAQLHPLDQAKEMVKLSVALMGGNDDKQVSAPRPIGQIKSNPVTSQTITEKTPIGDLRARMKAGWK